MQGGNGADVIFAQVASKSQTPATEQYSESTFLRLAGGAITLMAIGQKALDLPADGSWAVFELQRTRGKFGAIKRWGWCVAIKDQETDNPHFDVSWQREFAAQSVGGGVSRNGQKR
jgi:hypothetical protein